MAPPPAFIAAFATLFAAGIAATVSLVVSVLSKEQKTSEFRQQWIDALRIDVAEWLAEVALLYHLGSALEKLDSAANERAIEQRWANLVKARMLAARIELRLNPVEHSKMLLAINALRDTPISTDRLLIEKRVLAVTTESKVILKAEWDRVKHGEPGFIWTKRIAAGLVAIALVVTGTLALRAW